MILDTSSHIQKKKFCCSRLLNYESECARNFFFSNDQMKNTIGGISKEVKRSEQA